MASTTDDADRDELAPLAIPSGSSGDLTASPAPPPTRVDRPRDRPAPTISSSPVEPDSQPSASQWQPHRTEATRLWAELGIPAVSGGVSPAVQPTTEPPAVEAGKRSTAPDTTAPVSPPRMPDASAVATDSDELGPTRFQSSAVAPAFPAEALPPSTPEPSTSVRPAALASELFARESISRPAASGESRRQTEPAAPPAGIESAVSKTGQKTPAERILGRADGRPTVEPHIMEPIADVLLHQARTEPAPTIRVTIGRIEIRAAVSPAPPPRARPLRRQPALPLDQYLQRRNEGKR
jgi:hypothetical protein